MPDDLPAACPECGAEVTGWACEPGETYSHRGYVLSLPGPRYYTPCDCLVTVAEPRRPDRIPSGEHTSADTADVVADIDSAIEDWETSPDAATWTADGSHEHDPDWWTTQDMGNGAIYGDRPIATPWASYTYPDDPGSPHRPPPVIQWQFNAEPRDLTPTYAQINAQISEIIARYVESMVEVARRAEQWHSRHQALCREGWAVWHRGESPAPELPEAATPVQQVARLAADHSIYRDAELHADNITVRGLNRHTLDQLDTRVSRLQEPRYPS